MSNLTDAGRQIITSLSQRYGLSEAAVEHMARAVSNGGGSMAQFNVPELGGNGQWMAGGMTMVGDMFNHGLQATVSNLCGELANAMAGTLFFERPKVAPGMMGGLNWWPEELGQPSSTGGQNQARYAYFPQSRRLAFDPGNGQAVILLDTGDHNIGGFSQQQSGPGDPFMGVSVSSQYGQFALSSFPRVGGAAQQFAPEPQTVAQPEPMTESEPLPQPQIMPVPEPAPEPVASGVSTDEILSTIERLAKLRDAGALSEEEYSDKKSDLLARL
ncbi:MAG: SHOCT domain-containing protein [Paracoccaceae bacterium]